MPVILIVCRARNIKTAATFADGLAPKKGALQPRPQKSRILFEILPAECAKPMGVSMGVSKGLFTLSGGPRSSGVGFLLFSSSGGHKIKETYPTRPGSPSPCKQGLKHDLRCYSRGKNLSNRRYAAILVDQKCKQTRWRASCEDGILLDSRSWRQKHAR